MYVISFQYIVIAIMLFGGKNFFVNDIIKKAYEDNSLFD